MCLNMPFVNNQTFAQATKKNRRSNKILASKIMLFFLCVCSTTLGFHMEVLTQMRDWFDMNVFSKIEESAKISTLQFVPLNILPSIPRICMLLTNCFLTMMLKIKTRRICLLFPSKGRIGNSAYSRLEILFKIISYYALTIYGIKLYCTISVQLPLIWNLYLILYGQRPQPPKPRSGQLTPQEPPNPYEFSAASAVITSRFTTDPGAMGQ